MGKYLWIIMRACSKECLILLPHQSPYVSMEFNLFHISLYLLKVFGKKKNID